jgi:hypothetical protein
MKVHGGYLYIVLASHAPRGEGSQGGVETEPAVGEIQVNLLTQPPFGANAVDSMCSPCRPNRSEKC